MANIKVSELSTASSFESTDYTMIVQNGENKKILGENFGVIVESGANQYGNYIKFSNGTMICYGRQQINFASNIAYGNVYRGDLQTINLPAAYINLNYQRFISPVAPIHDSYSVDDGITTTSFGFFPISYTSQGADNRYINYFTIGNWK